MSKDQGTNAGLNREWRRWIAEKKIMQVEDKDLLEVLLQNGIDEQGAMKEVEVASDHPYIKAGVDIAERLKKLESLLDVYRALDKLSTTFGKVERRGNVSIEEFLEEYYCRNRPVVLTDVVQGWKALSLWTPEYLKEHFGDVEVEITVGRDSDALYEINVEKHKEKILLSDYVDMVLSGGETNDYYMVANNHTLELEGMKELLNDINSFPSFLNSKITANKTFLIFGPVGTVTPFHHDTVNVLLAQI
ncbi:MAG TPA: cupin-like domain-containing protein, partial [Pyrinomonadaceae bacterium]